jgi:RNA polymerase sigma-70 factor (ECF subfamily)
LAAALALSVAAAAAPPRVVKASPDNGATGVDPATPEIRVVFDQAMNTGGFSFVGGGETYPKARGKPTWLNDRTCVLPVALEPEHEYWLSINSDRFTNFRSAGGHAAVPYPIAFKTGPAKAGTSPPPSEAGPAKPAPTPSRLTPELNRAAIAQLKRAIDLDYSYRDLRKVNWDRLLAQAAPSLERTGTPAEFAEAAGKLLAEAKDIHIWLQAGGSTYPSFRRQVDPNCNVAALARLVPGWTAHNDLVSSGRWPDGVRYVLISAWDADKAGQLAPAYDVIRGADPARGLIIDVRPNSGGSEPLARQVAGCFVEKPVVYSRNTTRADGKVLGPYDRVLNPNAAGPAYRGKVVVLMGPRNMSSCESFLLMMKQVPGCRLVGARSYGSSGNPKPHDLGNGVTVYLPSWQDLMPDGKLLEGVGVEPDAAVPARAGDFARGDPVLEAALRVLRSPPPAGDRPAGSPRVEPSARSTKADGSCGTSAYAMCLKGAGADRFGLEEVLP